MIQVLRVFDVSTDDLGESAEEMSGRSREFVATYESTVFAKPSFDTIVVKDGQGNGRLANSASTNQCDWCEAFCEANNLLDQLVTSE